MKSIATITPALPENTTAFFAHVPAFRAHQSNVSVTLEVEVTIEREPKRGRCDRCKVRRVLYRAYLDTDPGALHFVPSTPARCATCWGIYPSPTE